MSHSRCRKRNAASVPTLQAQTFEFSEDEFEGDVLRAQVDRVQGRRIQRETQAVHIPKKLCDYGTSDSCTAQPSLDEVIQNEGGAELPTSNSQNDGPSKKKARKKHELASVEHDKALREWIPYRQRYLDEMLCGEGLQGKLPSLCFRFNATVPTSSAFLYRCKDCQNPQLTCQECCVQTHRSHPFHRVKYWNGQYFVKSTLKDASLVLQLGHPPNEACASPVPGPRNFVIIDTNGFHPTEILFCECDQACLSGGRIQQLLRAKLYPATIMDPSTCCTFRLLEHFHMMTLQSKTTAYDYYQTLQMLTDSSGLGQTFNRLHAFMHMVREWRNLKVLKRAGRGHEEDGIEKTAPGELSIRCPACPVPGWNLPDNWDTVSDDMKFLYYIFVAVDANFRLKRRAISNESRDPALSLDQNNICSCTGLAALLQANTKFSKGYSTTGVGMAIDARHGFILPNSAGDLQKGERYCNMDYIILSALCGLKQLHGILSYDIMCQWLKNFFQRMKTLPPHLQVEIPKGDMRYAIPKYHLNAHREEDHNRYSLNLIPGAARMDGEEIERNWSRHDGAATSTREMGPGSRHDTLEDYFGFANWRKYVGLGIALRKRLQSARIEQHNQIDTYNRWKAKMRPANVALWTEQIRAWEKDPSMPDPY
ncbi:hypothetical protein K474DRAFT_1713270 [Panus rudis PR-1116 ss-1]|nr:hypothetical protein K474DRAFT_1713270 [Panus rudis PR-1116 ss-1]